MAKLQVQRPLEEGHRPCADGNGGAYTPPLASYLPFSVPVAARRRTILVELTATLFTADSVSPFLPELLATFLTADRIIFPLTRTARIDPHATRSDVDALSDCWNGWDPQKASRYQPAHDDLLHVYVLSS